MALNSYRDLLLWDKFAFVCDSIPQNTHDPPVHLQYSIFNRLNSHKITDWNSKFYVRLFGWFACCCFFSQLQLLFVQLKIRLCLWSYSWLFSVATWFKYVFLIWIFKKCVNFSPSVNPSFVKIFLGIIAVFGSD